MLFTLRRQPGHDDDKILVAFLQGDFVNTEQRQIGHRRPIHLPLNMTIKNALNRLNSKIPFETDVAERAIDQLA